MRTTLLRSGGQGWAIPVEFRDGMGSRFPHIGGHVRGSFLDCQHHDRHYDGHTDAREDAEGTGTNQLIGILRAEVEAEA